MDQGQNYTNLDNIKLILGFFVFWNVINYIALKVDIPDGHLKRNEWLDCRNRIVSFIHGLICIFVPGYILISDSQECGNPNTLTMKFQIACSCGYFLYDFVAMAYFGLLDAGMIIHHSIGVIGFYVALISNTPLNLLISLIFWFEVSNPAMHLRMILKYIGLRYTLMYESLEVSYIITYVLGRLGMGTLTKYKIFMCDDYSIIIKILCVGLAFFSYFYIARMFSILKSRYLEYLERQRKGVQMDWLRPLPESELEKLDSYKKKNKHAKIY